nr:undecaprenyl diphosphate synthase family protein [Angustibacter aerolatus]
MIRTSGEQRLGGFLLWQSAHSEFYFCEAYWPAFRKVDFLRALRSLRRPRAPLRHLTSRAATARWHPGERRVTRGVSRRTPGRPA